MGGTDLAARLRTLRLAAGMTLETLAERSGVSVRGISDIERGRSRHPQPRTIEALVLGLGLDEAARRWLRAPLVGAGSGAGPDTGRTDFRPPRVADFTGRSDELERLVAGLDRPSGPPVVVVSGPPGIGKTALVTEAIGRAAGAERRVFVDLAGHGRPATTALEVLQRVLRQCDPDDPPGTLGAAAARWSELCTTERVLVHLDNVSSEDQVRPVLVEGRSTVVATSRRTLAGLDADRIVLGVLGPEDGRRLLERIVPAEQRDPAAVDELITLCDGFPLALRVAANRIASRPATSAADLVARLRSADRRLTLLVAGDVSVAAAIAVSYDDLDPGTAAVFRATAALDGVTFGADVVAAALGADPDEIESRLEGLVDLGLVEPRGARYRVHDIIRLFARERLREDPRAEAAAGERLTRWLLGRLLAAGSVFVVPGRAPVAQPDADQDVARDWILGEVDHWWPAYRRAAALGWHETVIELTAVLQWFANLWPDWGRWYELDLVAQRAADALADDAVRSRVAGHLAWAAHIELGDHDLAAQHADEALAAAERAGAPDLVAWGHYHVAWSALERGDPVAAEAHALTAVAGFEREDDPVFLHQARGMLGLALQTQGRYDEAVTALRAAVDGIVEGLDPVDERVRYAQALARAALASTLLEAGAPGEALEVLDAALRTLPDDTGTSIGLLLRSRAAVLVELGRPEEALADVERALHALPARVRPARLDPLHRELSALRDTLTDPAD
ncbi:helix-turn-helix domain-containing protein [Curtobacterium sp. A7_M15]|uniref:helix-turn-helix domain-containing protein n=1 Tax=Curtobacterium sp. A7_M15 TaxID=3065241 RepID=UPI002737A8AB|nr:helix-turn-helix domain-containing protein [Curtobacterium sp. A7_M15]MDP4332657.1 helix-turn-helix domain-containing protein [Curtobacterium sp. A7_M15]